MRQSVKRRRSLARQETAAYFVEPFGQRGLFDLAYSTLARKQVDMQRQFFYEVFKITCLTVYWQNLLEQIVPGDRSKVDATLRTTRNVAVVHGNCGTGGDLDALLERVGVFCILVLYCFEMFLGKPIFDDQMDSALEPFFLD